MIWIAAIVVKIVIIAVMILMIAQMTVSEPSFTTFIPVIRIMTYTQHLLVKITETIIILGAILLSHEQL